MGELTDFIIENDGDSIARHYNQYLKLLLEYDALTSPDIDKDVTEWMKLNGANDRGYVICGTDSTKMALVELGIKEHIEALMKSGWGNLPLVRDYYESFMEERFPINYGGVEIPEFESVE